MQCPIGPAAGKGCIQPQIGKPGFLAGYKLPWRPPHPAEALRARLDAGPGSSRAEAPPLLPPLDGLQLLDTLQLDQPLARTDYRRELDALQGRLRPADPPPRLCPTGAGGGVRGNDAAGKGGAIRGCRTGRASLPDCADCRALGRRTGHALAVALLAQVPRHGGVTVFDRSAWYGRVLVERIEGFAREHEWLRGTVEINDFEHQLADADVVLVKFWLAIDHDERAQTLFRPANEPVQTLQDYRRRLAATGKNGWHAKTPYIDVIDRTSTRT